MESQAFEVYSFSAFRFDFYTLLLYCVCTNCESFNKQKKHKKNVIFSNSYSSIDIEMFPFSEFMSVSINLMV